MRVELKRINKQCSDEPVVIVEHVGNAIKLQMEIENENQSCFLIT